MKKKSNINGNPLIYQILFISQPRVHMNIIEPFFLTETLLWYECMIQDHQTF